MSELDRNDLNVAFNIKIQKLLHQGLIPAVEKGLEDAWGDGWVTELNERRRGKPDPKNPKFTHKPVDPVPVRDGKIAWDTNILLHTIREHGRDMQNVRRDQARNLYTWCRDLADLRNGPSHFGLDNYHIVNADRKIGHQAELAIKLLRAFFAEKEASEIEALIDGAWTSGRAEGPKTRVEPEQVQPPLEPLPSEMPKATALASAYTFSPKAEVSHSRRRTPLPPPGAGVAVFPLAGQGGALAEDECLASATGTVLQSDSSGQFSIPTGPSGNESAFYQIIKDVRNNEPDGPKLIEKTRIRFDSNFMGDSFGLAVAIADRTARYGLSNGYEGRRIVATGALLPKHGGEVGAIRELPEKIEIVQRFVPSGSLFVIPRENLDKANQALIDVLAGLKASGIEWRAVSHIDDLNDLLAAFAPPTLVADKAATPVEPSSPPPPSVASSQIVPKPVTEKEPDVKQKRAVRSPLVTRRLLTGAALTALLLLTASYYTAAWLDGQQQDIAAIQASDERLQILSRTASGVQAGAEQADECEALISASKDISQYDLARFEDYHRHAMAQAKECASLLAQSDSRLNALFAAAAAAEATQPSTIVRLAETRSALSQFDLTRDKADDVKSAVSAGDRALSHVRASDERIATFNQLFAVWSADNSNGKAADSAAVAFGKLNEFDLAQPNSVAVRNIDSAKRMVSLLSESDGRINESILFLSAMEANNTAQTRQAAEQKISLLTDFDMSRVTPAQQAAIERGKEIARSARWSDFETAATAFTSKPTAENTLRLTATFAALTAADRVAMADRLRARRDTADVAQRHILESDARLTRLSGEYEAALAAEKKKSELSGAYQQVVEAAADLTELDRLRLSEQQKAALSRADELRLELDASDKRLLKAQTWAEIVLKGNGGAISRQLRQNIREARAALTSLDQERMSAELKLMLHDVCGVPVETKPGMLPAIAGFECFQESDFKPKLMPAIR